MRLFKNKDIKTKKPNLASNCSFVPVASFCYIDNQAVDYIIKIMNNKKVKVYNKKYLIQNTLKLLAKKRELCVKEIEKMHELKLLLEIELRKY